MVYYDPTFAAPYRPPPICPKCGSHRTQIVGLADNGQTLIVRCNACGERSEVKIEAGATPADFDLPTIDLPSL
jgi:transcription elongation factor Elf1